MIGEHVLVLALATALIALVSSAVWLLGLYWHIGTFGAASMGAGMSLLVLSWIGGGR